MSENRIKQEKKCVNKIEMNAIMKNSFYLYFMRFNTI